jgi:hypothetical protein
MSLTGGWFSAWAPSFLVSLAAHFWFSSNSREFGGVLIGHSSAKFARCCQVCCQNIRTSNNLLTKLVPHSDQNRPFVDVAGAARRSAIDTRCSE